MQYLFDPRQRADCPAGTRWILPLPHPHPTVTEFRSTPMLFPVSVHGSSLWDIIEIRDCKVVLERNRISMPTHWDVCTLVHLAGHPLWRLFPVVCSHPTPT